MDKDQYGAALSQVERVLWEDWDPIGVNHDPGARDEYRSYAPGVIRLLLQGADAARLCEHLVEIESSRIGSMCPTERRKSAANKLLRVLSETVAELPD